MKPVSGSPGTYILLLDVAAACEVQFGRARTAALAPGLYGYVGSARGPGGLAARLRRHLRGGRPHWHLDRLRPHAEPVGALVREGDARLECAWAAWLGRVAEDCIDGVGASDCRCRGHLYRIGVRSREVKLIEQASHELGAHRVVVKELDPTARPTKPELGRVRDRSSL